MVHIALDIAATTVFVTTAAGTYEDIMCHATGEITGRPTRLKRASKLSEAFSSNNLKKKLSLFREK